MFQRREPAWWAFWLGTRKQGSVRSCGSSQERKIQQSAKRNSPYRVFTLLPETRKPAADNLRSADGEESCGSDFRGSKRNAGDRQEPSYFQRQDAGTIG